VVVSYRCIIKDYPNVMSRRDPQRKGMPDREGLVWKKISSIIVSRLSSLNSATLVACGFFVYEIKLAL